MLKNSLKKILATVITASMLITMTACGEKANDTAVDTTVKYNAGKYLGTAEGHNNKLTVELELSEDAIKSITVTEHKESEGIADPALDKVPTAIVDGQTLNVDTVAGATVTSKAIIAAATAALKEAGVDTDKLQQKAENKEESKKENEEKTADVVIVGAGGAGLSAAIEAHKNGASVIIVEKMAGPGGNTAAAAGLLNAPDKERQEKQGIEDSVEKFIENTMEGGDHKNNPDLVKTMAENAYDAVKFWEEVGVTWDEKVIMGAGGLWPRGHLPVNGRGNELINVAIEYINKNNIELITETKATELIVKDGAVVGIKAEGNNTTYTLNANNGVILATGGFGANRDMVSQYDPSISKTVNSSNVPSATGDGIIMAEAVDANLVGMEYIQFYPTGVASTGSQKTDIPYTNDRIFVNKEGKRFVAEDERRDVQSQGIFSQTDKECWVIAGTNNLKSDDSSKELAEKTIAEGKAFRADTLEELAALINVDPAVLTKTVSDYNSYIDGENDPEVGRKIFGGKIDGAPYYAALRSPTLHHTCGGLEIDTDTRVLNKNGEIIKGLYAAGEVTGGVHGSNRLGGNAITDITVFGRIAGQNAAKAK